MTEEEFLEDFGRPGYTDEELEELLNGARSSGDADLRLVIKQFQALRWICRQVLARLEEHEPRANDTQGRLPNFLVRGEGEVEDGRAYQIAAPDAGGYAAVAGELSGVRRQKYRVGGRLIGRRGRVDRTRRRHRARSEADTS